MSLSDPVNSYEAVTPSDSADIVMTTALWVGTAGELTVTCPASRQPVTFPHASGWMPIQTTKVWSTNTGASDIVACRRA